MNNRDERDAVVVDLVRIARDDPDPVDVARRLLLYLGRRDRRVLLGLRLTELHSGEVVCALDWPGEPGSVGAVTEQELPGRGGSPAWRLELCAQRDDDGGGSTPLSPAVTEVLSLALEHATVRRDLDWSRGTSVWLSDTLEQINELAGLQSVLEASLRALARLAHVERLALYQVDRECPDAPSLLCALPPNQAAPESVQLAAADGTVLLGSGGAPAVQLGWSMTEGAGQFVKQLPGQLGDIRSGDPRPPMTILCLARGAGSGPFPRACRDTLETFTQHLAQVVVNQLELSKRRQQAQFDDLTGLAARHNFFAELEREISRAHRYRTPLSVLMIDADHFKRVNDRYGHATGDAVLVAMAECLRFETRTTDLVGRLTEPSHNHLGRLGGEEMAVMLPGADEAQAAFVADRLRRAIRDVVVRSKGARVGVSVSIGVAAWRESMGCEELMEAADQALYAAKHGGRDQVCRASAGQLIAGKASA